MASFEEGEIAKEIAAINASRAEEDSKPRVTEVRVIYKSGAYVQAWFDEFDVVVDPNNGQMERLSFKIATTHPDSKYSIIMPMYINPERVESVWFIRSLSQEQFYMETAGKI